MTKPLIGISTKQIAVQDYSIEVLGMTAAYAQSVREAGGVPLYLPVGSAHDAEEAISECDGLLLAGGEDVDPSLYGEAPLPQLGKVARERDDFEIAAFLAARKRGMPVLGVCRGLQLINVACGGSLFQDIPSQCPSSISHTTADDRWHTIAHEVSIVADTKTYGVLGQVRIPVNSIHHQAIKQLGEMLIASATSDDGMIEAIESQDGQVLAVQWHPEVMWQPDEGMNDPHALKPFSWLVSASLLAK